MSNRTVPRHLTTSTLADAVAAEARVSHEQAQRTIAALLDIVTRSLAAGHSVSITNFGTWRPAELAPRKARNPQTGERVTVESHIAVRWRTSPRLREIVRNQDTGRSVRKLPKGTLTGAGETA